MNRPPIKHQPDLSAIIRSCEKYFERLESDDYAEDEQGDFDQEIVENALAALYGDQVFEYIAECQRALGLTD